MARDLPYFKFFCSEWNDGDIALEDLAVQGLFINLCSYYWSNECNITLTKCKKKFKTASDADFDCLVDSNIIKVDKDDNLLINFLIEQFSEREEKSKTNSLNGSLGGRPRKATQKPIESENKPNGFDSESETKGNKRREEEIREEKKRKEEEEIKNELLESIIEKQDISPFKDDSLKKPWHEWKMFRIEKQNPLTPSSERKALEVLFEESGGKVDLAIKAINKSIASGHISLNPKPEPTFKPKEEPKPKRVYE